MGIDADLQVFGGKGFIFSQNYFFGWSDQLIDWLTDQLFCSERAWLRLNSTFMIGVLSLKLIGDKSRCRKVSRHVEIDEIVLFPFTKFQIQEISAVPRNAEPLV